MNATRLLVLFVTILAASAAAAQVRPVKIVVAAPPGSTQDAVARTIAGRLGEALGAPVTVDNRPATSDGAAADLVAKSAPDGQTLLLATPAIAALSALQPNLPFDGIKAFAPVARIASEPFVLVASATLPTSSPQELIALAKANPGRINYASAGGGSASHLAGELFKSVATVALAHAPAKSTEEALAEVVAGRARVMFIALAAAEPALRSGKVKALAVASPTRLASWPEVPTLRETGVLDYDFTGWIGLLAPAATPKAVVDRLNADLRRVLQAPDVRNKLTALLGAEPRVGTPDEFAVQLRREVAIFEKLARERNLKVE